MDEITGNELATFWRTLEKLEDGLLSVSEGEDLAQRLDQSPEARAVYLEYFELMTMLQVTSELRAEEGRIPAIGAGGTQRKAFHVSLIAAAAALILFVATTALIDIMQPAPPVATVQVAHGTIWMLEGQTQDPDSSGHKISAGATVSVSSGVVALTLDSGIRMLLQGPMNVTFPKLDQPFLKHGWLWIDSDGNSKDLQVDTPDLRIRDIGTRFGVMVHRDRSAEIHLINGKVEASVKGSNEVVIIGPKAKAMTVPTPWGDEDLPLAADPFPELAQLLSRPGSYVTTILGQSPSGYWRLNDLEGTKLANSVSGGIQGHRGSSAQSTEQEIQPVNGFNGFEPENLSLFLTGLDKNSIVRNLDVPRGVSPKEGGVSFWFRREGQSSREEILWHAGATGSSGLGPEDEMHFYLGVEGRVRFFMENGENDILLSSSRDVTDGRWHHVAGSWGKSKVELFLDGKSVMTDTAPRYLNDRIFRGTEVRFGKARLNYEGRQYEGWVDEIAYWDRMLTPAEVTNQYQSAISPDRLKASAR